MCNVDFKFLIYYVGSNNAFLKLCCSTNYNMLKGNGTLYRNNAQIPFTYTHIIKGGWSLLIDAPC